MDTLAHKKIIALFGGTFNPIHNGHVGALRQLQQQGDFAKTYIIPNAIPPHRDDKQIAAEHRLAMCRLAVEGMTKVVVSNFEIEQVGKPSYSVDTVAHFYQNKQADEKLIFIVGEDSYNSFTQWHQWQQILQYCSLLVMQRKSSEQDYADENNRQMLEKYHMPIKKLSNGPESGAIFFANNDYFPYSSTQIRTWLDNRIQCSAKNMSGNAEHNADQDLKQKQISKNINLALDTKVLDYIKEQHLYNY